jgi:hypothetical protein
MYSRILSPAVAATHPNSNTAPVNANDVMPTDLWAQWQRSASASRIYGAPASHG